MWDLTVRTGVCPEPWAQAGLWLVSPPSAGLWEVLRSDPLCLLIVLQRSGTAETGLHHGPLGMVSMPESVLGRAL